MRTCTGCHLNARQRGSLVARLAGLEQGQRKEGGDVLTAQEAADEVGVGLRTVQRANKVLRNGAASLQKAVGMEGSRSVTRRSRWRYRRRRGNVQSRR